MGMTLGLGSACTGLLTRGTPSSKGPGEAGHAQLAHHGSPHRLATVGEGGPHPTWHPLDAAMVQKQFRHRALTLR